MDYPKSLIELMQSFEALPSIGKKSAERLAIYVYSNMDEDSVDSFAKNLVNVKKNLKRCAICGNLSENEICDICQDSKRNHELVMVVENIKDLFVLEKINEYKGVYHVLNGAISFSNGIGVDDINIASLVQKVKENKVKEIILATNATLEGETTARYIKTLLEEYDVVITRIAHGLPVGGDLSYADEMTVLKALEGRRKY